MKTDIHPTVNPVIFIDTSTGDEWVSRSTLKSKETRDIDGVEHFVVKLEISSYSHPFWTGNLKLLDAAGRIDRFKKRFARTDGKTVKRKKKVMKRKLTGVVKKAKKTLSTAPHAEKKEKGGKKKAS